MTSEYSEVSVGPRAIIPCKGHWRLNFAIDMIVYASESLNQLNVKCEWTV